MYRICDNETIVNEPNAQKRLSFWMKLLIAISVIGLVIRLYIFCLCRSFWIDEAMLAINIGSHAFFDFFQPLDFAQTAAIGYLYLQKIVVLLFGLSEYSLRLLPLICGISLIPLLGISGAYIFNDRVGIIAATVGALSPPLVHYSCEAKQYGVDVLLTVLLLLFWHFLNKDTKSLRMWTGLGLAGIVVILISQTAPVVLAGPWVALMLGGLIRRDRTTWARCIYIGSIWLSIYGILFFLYYRSTAHFDYMVHFWKPTFLSPWSMDYPERLRNFILNIFWWPFTPVIREPSWLVIILIVAAFAFMAFLAAKYFGIEKTALLIAPIACLFVLATFGIYPVSARLYLFIYPLILLVFAQAVATSTGWFREQRIRDGLLIAVWIVWLPWPGSFLSYVMRPASTSSRDLIAVVRSSPINEPVYIFSKGIPIWLIYTTDWKRMNTGRLDWYLSISSEPDAPAFHNRRSRNVDVVREGYALTASFEGRTEIAGIPTGFEIQGIINHLKQNPDCGWPENEADRIADQANPSIWVFVSQYFDFELAPLRAAIRRRGGREETSIQGESSILIRYRFTERREN